LGSSTKKSRSRPIKWFAKKLQWEYCSFLSCEWFDIEDKNKVLPELEHIRNFIANDASDVRFRTYEKEQARAYIMKEFKK
jgi:hypothetical protein